MIEHGFHPGPLFDISKQVEFLPEVFGNTLFAFIFHFTLSTIIYSMRPQMKSETMIMNANILGASLLAIEALLGWMAFGEFNHKKCPKDFENCNIKQLYNENFT